MLRSSSFSRAAFHTATKCRQVYPFFAASPSQVDDSFVSHGTQPTQNTKAARCKQCWPCSVLPCYLVTLWTPSLANVWVHRTGHDDDVRSSSTHQPSAMWLLRLQPGNRGTEKPTLWIYQHLTRWLKYSAVSAFTASPQAVCAFVVP